MTDIPTLVDGADNARALLILAHGAGAPMDSPFMAGIAARLAARHCRVVRFEFSYMAQRRADGGKKPPDREPRLRKTFAAAIAQAAREQPGVPLFIGGKSMGGRIASMIADQMAQSDWNLRGVICLGYPFHPPGRPEKTRIAHLAAQHTPTLIVQGTRDRFGPPADVANYPLSRAVQVRWLEGGDHSLTPLKSSGRTAEDCWDEAATLAAGFMDASG